MSYYVDFEGVFAFSFLGEVFYVAQAHHDLRHLDVVDVSVSDKKRNVTSRRLFTHHCSETDALRHTLHFLKVIL